MNSGRLEAFSDGVLAIIITIMVLELEIPEEATWEVLLDMLPIFLTYIVSFVYVGIYWNNHHHIFQITDKVNGNVLWANLHLLFWLSLLPFVTGWMGENHFQDIPTAAYGFVLFMCAVAWQILSVQMIKCNGKDSKLAKVYAKDKKKYGSIALYAAGIILSFIYEPAAALCYVFVAVMWFIPDKRIEKVQA